jgi:hypothetical protein
VLFAIVVGVALLVAALERGRPEQIGWAVRALEGRWCPAVVGVLWAGVIWCAWGALRPSPVFHDELAYLFQARLFAAGRWAASSPPMADAFAQPHVLVAPVMASKYPPGHSLLLAVGQWIGLPALVVVGLAALKAAVTFALARRLATGAVALATCIFLLYGDSLVWSGSYFSETTTGALLVVAWYALLRWHRDAEPRWIALLALALGWSAITRPFSAVLFALPIAAVVLRDVARRGRWRDLVLALVVGSAIVAILPLWSARTTGDWRVWPATLYTRDYMPFDYPHFGVEPAAPRREAPPDIAAVNVSLRDLEQQHRVRFLPQIARERYAFLDVTTWREPVPEAALALVGLAVVPAAAWVGVATAVTVFAGYLAHPTWPTWTIYCMEIAPVLVFLTVCGLYRLLGLVAREPAGGAGERGWRATRALLVVCALSLALVPRDVRMMRQANGTLRLYQQRFRAAAARIPSPRVLLFVRHAATHSEHFTLVANDPDWQDTHVLMAIDRGDARNAEVIRRFPDREPFLFDERAAMINPYRPPAAR